MGNITFRIKEIVLDKLIPNPSDNEPLKGKLKVSVIKDNTTFICSADISQKGSIFDPDKVEVSNISGFDINEADLRRAFKKWWEDLTKGGKPAYIQCKFTYN